MDVVLNEYELRVMGALTEKQIATPDYYPMTLNALVNACNQKNHRDPVVSYDEATVTSFIQGYLAAQVKRVVAEDGRRVRRDGFCGVRWEDGLLHRWAMDDERRQRCPSAA